MVIGTADPEKLASTYYYIHDFQKKKYFSEQFRIVGCAGGDGAIGGVNIEKDKTAKRPLKSFA